MVADAAADEDGEPHQVRASLTQHRRLQGMKTLTTQAGNDAAVAWLAHLASWVLLEDYERYRLSSAHTTITIIITIILIFMFALTDI